MPYLTPDDSGGTFTLCRRLSIPVELAGIVTYALEQLTHPSQYQEWGTLTRQETADLAESMFQEYLTGGDNCMIGTLVQYLTETAPQYVLPCDGSTYDDVDYPELAAVISAQWDNGDGTFTLPDLRGRMTIGTGTGASLTARSEGDTGGAETHTLTIAEMPNHDHTYLDAGLPDVPVLAPGEAPVNALSNPAVTGATGGGNAHNNMPPFVAIKIGVWYK